MKQRNKVAVKLLVLTMLLMPVTHTFAASLNAVLQGSEQNATIDWLNGVSQGGYITTSYWPLAPQLQPTEKWVPALTTQGAPTQVTLTNGDQSITSAISISGLEYNLGSAASKFVDKAVPAYVGAKRCNTMTTTQTTRLLGAANSSCVGDRMYMTRSGQSVTPFQFIRPIFKLDNLLNDFVHSDVSSGTYRGHISFNSRFLFASANGRLTYRNIPITLGLSIRYKREYITEVVVSGGDYIKPVYDTEQNTVSGANIYNVDVKGLFTGGLQLTFDNPSGDNGYYLKADEGDTRIPYSIRCIECSEPSVVDQGNLQLTYGRTTVPGSGEAQSFMSFNLALSYRNIKQADVETSVYRDTFTMLLQPIL